MDEGHRLKSKSTRLFESLKHLDAERRVLLTGTPIQNAIETPGETEVFEFEADQWAHLFYDALVGSDDVGVTNISA